MCATEIKDTVCQTQTSAKLLFVDIDNFMHIALYITITFDMIFLFLETAKGSTVCYHYNFNSNASLPLGNKFNKTKIIKTF